MSDSEDDLERQSEDDFPTDKTVSTIKHAAAGGRKKKSSHAMATEDGGYAWTADYKRSWDAVQEDASGSITSAVEGIIEAGKRRRLLKDATPVQRGIIRHLVLVLDFGISMAEKDLRPSRVELSVNYACDFVNEYFEQNPISQLAIIGMLDGVAIPVSPLGGNPQDHIAALQARKKQECKGDASLQNALEMARATLFHVPTHGTREVLMIYGGLVSSDPGDIHTTIKSLVADSIRVSIVGLAASLAICKEIVKRTNQGRVEGYGVILNEYHFKELLMHATTPPASTSQNNGSNNSLIMIGFPSRRGAAEETATLCACHSQLRYGGYDCPRCGSMVCSLPAECPSCALTLILSTHLARSYHHLFPLRNWEDVTWEDADTDACFACLTTFPVRPGRGPGEDSDSDDDVVRVRGHKPQRPTTKTKESGTTASESGRYSCPACRRHFCIECDLFAHEVLFECPGCQAGLGRKNAGHSKTLEPPVGADTNGQRGGDPDVVMSTART